MTRIKGGPPRGVPPAAVPALDGAGKADRADEAPVRDVIASPRAPDANAVSQALGQATPSSVQRRDSSAAPWRVATTAVEEKAMAFATPAWFASEAFQANLDERTSSTRTDGNKLELLVNGVASQARREANIAEADVVLLKTYNFRDDATGNRMLELLTERAKAGAKVYLQFDVKGLSRDAKKIFLDGLFDRYKLPPQFQKLEDAGGVLIPTNVDSVNAIYGKDHEKYIVTMKEGEPAKLIMGGMNVGDEWALGGQDVTVPALHDHHGFRDTDVEIQGPAVQNVIEEFVVDADRAQHDHRGLKDPVYTDAEHASLRELAEALRADEKAHAKCGEAGMRFVANRPRDGAQHIESLYLAMLDEVPAGETVTMVSPFFLPTDEIVESIKTNAQRGVKFRLLFNGTDSVEAGFRIVATGARSVYRELFALEEKHGLEGAFEIYEYKGSPDKGVSSLHHKLARFGDEGPILVGSSNLDYHSLRHNTEGVMLVEGENEKAAFAKMLEGDFEPDEVRRITRSDVEDVGLWQSLKEEAVRKLRYLL